ncbi:MAG: tetratricopeptide repeat protein, partial [Promethearchaeota archaeon]
KALVCYEKAVELAPYDVDLWISMGNAYCAHDELRSGIESYEKAINIAPDIAIKRDIPIIECYRKVLKSTHDDPDLWINLGYVYEYKKEPERAAECYEKALQIDPTNALARYKIFEEKK